MSNWVVAKLKTRNYQNGIPAIADEVPLGKLYLVDLDSVCWGWNQSTDGSFAAFRVEMIKVMPHGWLPTEVFDIEVPPEDALEKMQYMIDAVTRVAAERTDDV